MLPAKWYRRILPLDLIRDTGRHMEKAQLPLVASSLAYTTILSIIPMLAVSFAIFKAFGGLEKLYQAIEPFILENLAEGSSDEVITQLRHFLDNAQAATIGVGGLVGLVFTSMSMLFSIEKAVNQLWSAPLRRNFFQRVSIYWLFITLGPLALSVAVGAATTANLPISHLFPNGTGLFVITLGVFFSLFQFVPNCQVHWQHSLAAAVVTAVFWDLARLGYVFYTHKAVTYSKIYGSLSAVPILLLWIYIVWLIVLGGAALAAVLQKRLEGRAKPLPA